MTSPERTTDSEPPGAVAAPAPRLADRLIRAALGLAIAAGVAWGLWRLAGDSAAASVTGMLAGVATIAVWLIFETPGDPGGGWLGQVAVPGPVRLLGELVLLGLAAAAIWNGGSRAASETLLTVAGLHVFLSWERGAWLFCRRSTVEPGAE